MLYHLLYPFHETFTILNVTRYITFRTAAASITALVVSLLMGGWLIRRVPQRLFDGVLMMFAALAALRLIGAL